MAPKKVFHKRRFPPLRDYPKPRQLREITRAFSCGCNQTDEPVETWPNQTYYPVRLKLQKARQIPNR